MIQLEIYSPLCPWKAPGRNGNRYYDPQSKLKEQIKWQLRAQYRGEIIGAAVVVDFTFFFPIPKATSKAKRRQMLQGIIVPMTTPDATNLQKALEDCLKGIVIGDDRQVSDITSKRRYAEAPGALIRIMTYTEKYGGACAGES